MIIIFASFLFFFIANKEDKSLINKLVTTSAISLLLALIILVISIIFPPQCIKKEISQKELLQQDNKCIIVHKNGEILFITKENDKGLLYDVFYTSCSFHFENNIQKPYVIIYRKVVFVNKTNYLLFVPAFSVFNYYEFHLSEKDIKSIINYNDFSEKEEEKSNCLLKK